MMLLLPASWWPRFSLAFVLMARVAPMLPILRSGGAEDVKGDDDNDD